MGTSRNFDFFPNVPRREKFNEKNFPEHGFFGLQFSFSIDGTYGLKRTV